MLLYEARIREEFSRIKTYTSNLCRKFESETSYADLETETENLEALFDHLTQLLPEQIRDQSAFRRHAGFIKYYLRKKECQNALGNLTDICNYDLPQLEKAFLDWCRQAAHYDEELRKGISDLLVRHELDSAIRKSFVILKSRITRIFGLPEDIDGPELVNRAFGKKPATQVSLSDAERQGLRDLLCGLYAVFRNKYAHNNTKAPWHVAEAVVSMVNAVLKELDQIQVHSYTGKHGPNSN
jgi:hypothetical protein